MGEDETKTIWWVVSEVLEAELEGAEMKLRLSGMETKLKGYG